MTARAPLVVGSTGLPQQLQAGDTLAGASSGATTPTTMQANLIVADNTQMLFRRRITTQAGQRITIGANAALVGV